MLGGCAVYGFRVFGVKGLGSAPFPATPRNAFGCLVADAMRWTYREQGLLCFGVFERWFWVFRLNSQLGKVGFMY